MLETEHYLAENFIFDDRQYEQHARSRCEFPFSSVEFERLSFGSEENELGACVMLICRGPSKKHRFSTKHDLRRARSRPHPSPDLCENLTDKISQVYIFRQKSFKSETASAFELLTLARTGGGGLVQPPLMFFADSEKKAARSAARFWATLWGKHSAIFGKKKLTGSGQVTEL